MRRGGNTTAGVITAPKRIAIFADPGRVRVRCHIRITIRAVVDAIRARKCYVRIRLFAFSNGEYPRRRSSHAKCRRGVSSPFEFSWIISRGGSLLMPHFPHGDPEYRGFFPEKYLYRRGTASPESPNEDYVNRYFRQARSPMSGSCEYATYFIFKYRANVGHSLHHPTQR